MASKYDVIANRLSRKIFERVIRLKDVVEKNGKTTFYLITNELNIDFIRVDVIKKRSLKTKTSTGGECAWHWRNNKNLFFCNEDKQARHIYLDIYLKNLKTNSWYEHLSYSIKCVLRHEIEHSLQPISFKFYQGYDKCLEIKSKEKRYKALLKYYIHTDEIGTYVKCIYFEAKKKRMSFIQSLEYFINKRLKNYDKKYLSKKQLNTLYSKVKNKWISFAKKHIPKDKIYFCAKKYSSLKKQKRCEVI